MQHIIKGSSYSQQIILCFQDQLNTVNYLGFYFFFNYFKTLSVIIKTSKKFPFHPFKKELVVSIVPKNSSLNGCDLVQEISKRIHIRFIIKCLLNNNYLTNYYLSIYIRVYLFNLLRKSLILGIFFSFIFID